MEEQNGVKVIPSISYIFPPDQPRPKPFLLSGESKMYLHSNYHQVSCNYTSVLYKYSVVTEPDITCSESICRLVYQMLFPDGGNINSNEEWKKILFAGNGTLISQRNDLEKEEVVENSVRIKVIYDKELRISENKEDLAIVFKQILDKSFLNQRHSCWDNEYVIDTDYKDEGMVRFLRAYKPVISLIDNNLFFSIDMTIKIDGKRSLYDLLYLGNDIKRRQHLEEVAHQMNFVLGSSKQRKTVKIKNIIWDSKPLDEIINMTKRESLHEFFLHYYSIVSKPNDIVIELSNNQLCPASALTRYGLTEIEKQEKNINDSLQKFINLTPLNRKKYIESIFNSIDNDELSNYNINIEENMVLNGHILDQPLLTVRKNDITHEKTKISGNDQMIFDLTKSSVAVPPRIHTAPLIISPQRFSNRITEEFIPKLLEYCKKYDVIFPYPEYRVLKESFKNLIFDYIKDNGTPSFILFIYDFDNPNSLDYSYMKNFLTLTLSIPSQFVSSKILDNSSNHFQDIIFQITSKLGGIPFFVSMPLKHTMILGISTISRGKDYIISLTASYDQTHARYRSKCFISKSIYIGDSDNSKTYFQKFFQDSIELFNKYYLKDPAQLIIYRMVENNENIIQSKSIELPFILKTIKNIRMVFCTVQKSTPIRLFIDDGDTSENPLPGTVVFENICSSDLSEFYLISNYTTMPVHYNILYNGPNASFKSQYFALLSYYLCCNNPTFPGATRLPAPLHNSLKLSHFYSNVLEYQREKEKTSNLFDRLLYFI